MNFSMGYSTGNQFDIGKKEHTVGWLGAISYNNQTEYYSEAIDNYFNPIQIQRLCSGYF